MPAETVSLVKGGMQVLRDERFIVDDQNGKPDRRAVLPTTPEKG
jgi:hypothetical protein